MISLVVVLVCSLLLWFPLSIGAHPAQQSAVNTLKTKVKTLENKVKQLEKAKGGGTVESDLYLLTDTHGVAIGTVTNTCCDDSVVHVTGPINGRKVSFLATKTELLGLSWDILFTSLDCTGQPYTQHHSGILPTNVIFAPGRTLYVPDGAPQSVTPQSVGFVIINPGQPTETACLTFEEMGWPVMPHSLAPLLPLVDLDVVFVSPFKVE